MSKLEGIPFDNGPTCKGTNYVSSDGTMDMARISIEGRYPQDENQWAINKVSRGLAHLVVGTGTLLLKDESPVSLEANESVEIAPNTCYAWKGHFTMVMIFDPPFNAEQYELKEG